MIGRMLAEWVFPPLCPVTGEETAADGTLSPAAWAGLAFLTGGPRCGACGREVPGAPPAADLRCDVCTAVPRRWDRGRAALRYEGSGRAMVMALKHGDRLDLAPLLARWMAMAGPELVADADLIVPVPLHWWRLVRRRHNQSAELARALATQAGKRGAFRPRLLRRTRPTAVSDGLDRAERIANLEGALALAPGAARALAGRRVLLIDDVMTTGATLEACTAALRAGGAAHVDVLVSTLVHFEGTPYLQTRPEREEEQA